MASIGIRIGANGKESWRVQGRARSGKHEQVTFDTKPAAESFVRLVKKTSWERAREIVTEQANITKNSTCLREVFPKFLASLRHLQPGTAAEYGMIPERSGWLQKLGDIPLEILTRDDVEEWVDWRYKTPLPSTGRPPSAKTVNEAKSLLSQTLTWAVERDLARANVARGVKTKANDGAKKVMITAEEFAGFYSVVQATEPHIAGFVLLLAMTGLRFNEARALSWSRISNHANPTITIDAAFKRKVRGVPQKIGDPKTGAGFRSVQVPGFVLEALGPRGKRTDFVFPHATRPNEPICEESTRRAFNRAAARANMPNGFTPHQLRHYYASLLLDRGVPISDVKVLLGHESITTTVDTYASMMPHASSRAVTALVDSMHLAHHGEIES